MSIKITTKTSILVDKNKLIITNFKATGKNI